MKRQLTRTYEKIISIENLLAAWQEFIRGKRKKLDVQAFSLELMDNILSLHDDLANYTYCHGGYQNFYITDPKRRHIHKACVRDRLLHHAVYRILYPFFDKKFIAESYSCRKNKGTQKAINCFRSFAYQASQNHTQTCWVLKCDIKKFFASVDHNILLHILNQYIPDKNIMDLLENIIDSFHTQNQNNKGLPLGNLTSQLFINIYMNQFDQWIKHKLKVKYYVRYADDFIILSSDKDYPQKILPKIRRFLNDKLNLTLHPNKISLSTIASGVDFLGWVQFYDHRVLRRTTWRRMLKRIKAGSEPEVVQSYLGLLKYGNTHKIKQELRNVTGWSL